MKKEQIIELCKKGVPTKDISRIVDTSLTYVYYVLRNAKIDYKNLCPTKVPCIKRAKEYVEEKGWLARHEAMKLVGCTLRTVNEVDNNYIWVRLARLRNKSPRILYWLVKTDKLDEWINKHIDIIYEELKERYKQIPRSWNLAGAINTYLIPREVAIKAARIIMKSHRSRHG